MNDPVNSVDRDGMWSLGGFWSDVFNVDKSAVSTVVSLVGEASEMAMDLIVDAVDVTIDFARKTIDAGLKLLDEVKQAYDAVAEAVIGGVMALKEAWDDLDPGLKQWIAFALFKFEGLSMCCHASPTSGFLLW